MLVPTLVQRPWIKPGQPRLRLGTQAPEGSVNLAYTFAPALNPQENVIIVDTSGFIPENVAGTDQVLLMWPDEAQLLRDELGRAEIPSQTPLLTDIFAGETPLFYSQRLRYPIFDPVGPDSFGLYRGTGVTVKDLAGQPLPEHLKFRVVLVAAPWKQHYWVHVYTSFQTGGIDNYRVQYSAVEMVEGAAKPRIGYTETLNPQPAFRPANVLGDVIYGNPAEPHYYPGNAPEFGHSRAYVPRPVIRDKRRPVSFTVWVEGNGKEFHRFTQAVLNPASVLPQDNLYRNGSLLLLANVYEDARQSNLPGLDENTIFTAHSDNPAVRVTCRPDGKGPLLVTTRANTNAIDSQGKPYKFMAPESYRRRMRLDGGNDFIPTYAVRLTERKQVRALPPLETGPLESWYLRVQNGRFRQGELGYFLPEYYRQAFDTDMGLPYRRVEGERPQVIGDRRIRLRYAPLFIPLDDQQRPDAARLSVSVNDEPMAVRRWNIGDGTLELAGTVQETDKIEVSYVYEEQALTYRGFWDNETGRYWHLDLNPGPGHLVTMRDDDGQIKDVPGFLLLDKTIYLYLRPAAEVSPDGRIRKGTFRRDTLFHSFEEREGALLLGKILVRPNAIKESVQVRDTRARGGGLKEEISAALMKELEPEAKHYFDIANWDGDPFQENAVVVIRLSRQLLKDFGGRFSHQEVEEIVHKHIAWGVLPIIEYVDDDLIVQRPENLVVDTVNVPPPYKAPLFKPRLRLAVVDSSPGN